MLIYDCLLPEGNTGGGVGGSWSGGDGEVGSCGGSGGGGSTIQINLFSLKVSNLVKARSTPMQKSFWLGFILSLKFNNSSILALTTKRKNIMSLSYTAIFQLRRTHNKKNMLCF